MLDLLIQTTATTAKTTTKISIVDVDANAIGSDGGLPTPDVDNNSIAGGNHEDTNHTSNEKPTAASGSNKDIDCTNKDFVSSSDCTKVSKYIS